MKLIIRAWIKIKFLIECSALMVDGVNQHRSNTEDISGLFYTEQRIFQECATEATSLLFFVNCQPSQKTDRNGMIRESLGYASDSGFLGYAASGDRIVAYHRIITMNDICSSTVIRLVLKSVFLQPAI